MHRRMLRLGLAALLAMAFGLMPLRTIAIAQTPPSPGAAATTLSEATIRSLQEALNKQGIAVPVSGVLNEETRAAVSKYQGQHHLPVTGEPNKATLDKLGVQIGAAPNAGTVVAQSSGPPSSAPATTPQAGAMGCPMMQQQMGAMMQMMQGMMDMMKSMQVHHGPMMQPGPMMPGMPGSMPR